MEDALSLLELFGERYVFCDVEQAMLDAEYARENISAAFIAILNIVKRECESQN
jgi:hypothetical protein